MEVNFKDLRKFCPELTKNNICKILKYYDCAEYQCPMNARLQNQTNVQPAKVQNSVIKF